MSVREALPDDAEAAVAVVRRSIEELCFADHRNDPATLSRWLSNKTPEAFLRWLANPEHFCVVAESEGRICGVGLLHRDGEVMLFYLLPEAQRKGIGTSIYQVLEQQAADWGLDKLHLDSTSLARRFYEAQGFRAVGPPKEAFGVVKSYPYEKSLVT